MLKTIAGSLIGKSKNHVVVINENNEIVESLKILGDRIYVSKCRKNENTGGIILTDRSAANCTFFLVLAVGTKYQGDIEVMEQITLPDSTLDAERSGFNPDEYVVPSSECQMAYKPQE